MSLLTGVVAHWKLDEASGNRADSHGSNTLTDNNTVTSSTGKIGNCAVFTRANSESLSISDNTDLSAGDIDFSICGAVKFSSTANTQVLISKGNDLVSTTNEYTLYYSSTSSRLIFRIRTVGGTDVQVSANNFGAPSSGVWYFFYAYHDSVNNVIGISINDGTPNTTSTTGGVKDSTGVFRFGNDNDAARYLDGSLDEVGFRKYLLSGAERTQLYNSGNLVPYPFFATTVGTGFLDDDNFGVGTSTSSITSTGTGLSDSDSFGTGSTTSSISSSGTGLYDPENFGIGVTYSYIANVGVGLYDDDNFGTGALSLSITTTGIGFVDDDLFGFGTVIIPQVSVGIGFYDADSFGVGICIGSAAPGQLGTVILVSYTTGTIELTSYKTGTIVLSTHLPGEING